MTDCALTMMTKRNPFDLTHLMPDGFPQTSYITYLLQPWVREHLGARVDYVEVSVVVDMGKLLLESS